jgi:hypothetical protein
MALLQCLEGLRDSCSSYPDQEQLSLSSSLPSDLPPLLERTLYFQISWYTVPALSTTVVTQYTESQATPLIDDQ